MKGRITASTLNVRQRPTTRSRVVGKLARGALVRIIARHGTWLEIDHNNRSAFVAGRYVEMLPDYFYQRDDYRRMPLPPEQAADLSTLAKAADVWNRYGRLLEALSGEIGIEPGIAVAVVCVESGGKGFSRDNRMIIRFENHWFWKLWGKDHSDVFSRHFRFDRRSTWRGHVFRASTRDPWERFHGVQAREWRALQLARGLNNDAALQSISMGAPQIMGFNFARIGYSSVQEMFDNFSRDIRYHFLGMFDFFDEAMIAALQRKSFVEFARRYNGPGQAARYGALIASYHRAFETLPRQR